MSVRVVRNASGNALAFYGIRQIHPAGKENVSGAVWRVVKLSDESCSDMWSSAW
jgi:hypothetical protein